METKNDLKICPVCKEEADFKFLQEHRNKFGEWTLYECLKCQIQFWFPFKNPGAEWYELDETYIVKTIGRQKISRGYHKKFLKVYKNFLKNIRILDLGCGTGEFLAELKKRGCEVWGVDFNKKFIESAKKFFGLKNLYAMSFDDFFKIDNLPKFDIITFFEVLEHIDNPLEFIQNVKNLLKENGMIVLSVPSRERILVNLIKGDFPPHHLSRWNEKAISNLFSKIGFKIFRVDYVKQFKFIFDSILQNVHFGIVEKTKKMLQTNKNHLPASPILILPKIVHFGAYLKDYILFSAPALILFLIGKITKQKNGDMLIWLKRV